MIPFPDISPEIFAITLFGMTFALRWYALAYIVGLVVGWRLVAAADAPPAPVAAATPPMTPEQVESLLTWVILGVVLGGRLGFVLFYQPAYYLANPAEILRVWEGGMSFHGGFLGVVVAALAVLPPAAASRCCPPPTRWPLATPPGLLLGRIANFINAELWGRPTTAALGRDLSRRGGAGLPRRRRALRPPPLAALRGGAGRAAPGRAAAVRRLAARLAEAARPDRRAVPRRLRRGAVLRRVLPPGRRAVRHRPTTRWAIVAFGAGLAWGRSCRCR